MSVEDLEKQLEEFPIFNLPYEPFPVEIMDQKEEFEQWHRKFTEKFVAFKHGNVMVPKQKFIKLINYLLEKLPYNTNEVFELLGLKELLKKEK